MPQVTIYLDTPTAQRMEAAVRKSGVSKSKWIAEAVAAKASSEWPQSVRDLFGSDPDFPDLASIRKTYGRDIKRETL